LACQPRGPGLMSVWMLLLSAAPAGRQKHGQQEEEEMRGLNGRRALKALCQLGTVRLH
jgi:hypothetical protein